MEKLINYLENDLAPKLNKISHMLWIDVIKQSMLQALPFIFVGAFCCLFTVFEGYLSLPFSFWQVYSWTLGKLGIIMAFLIPYNFCQKKKYRKTSVTAGITGIISYMCIITPQVLADGSTGFDSEALGAGGVFLAMITGCVASYIFTFFENKSFFKKDSVIPEFVQGWFNSMTPIALAVLISFIVGVVLNINLYQIIVDLISPIQNITNTAGGFVFIMFLQGFLYSMGVSTWVLTPILAPISLMNAETNMALVAAGTATAENMHVFTDCFVYCGYIAFGGMGSTLPLNIMMLRSKHEATKTLGKASLIPSLFNINEPIIFSTIAWNPIMMIPMWINSALIPLLSWIACKTIAFAPIPENNFYAFCPFPICTWISTNGSLVACLTVLVLIVIAGLVWYPFFKANERRLLAEESEK